MNFLYILMLAFFFSVPAAFAGAGEKPPLSIRELPDFTIAPGQVIYRRYCLFCHGETGKGDGQNSFSLATRPADLHHIIPARSDKLLAEVILQGGAKTGLSPAMPPFEHTLSEKQIRQLIISLENLTKKD